MQNVTTTLLHVHSQQTYALLVDDLKVGHELLCDIADTACRQFDPVLAGQLDRDLLILTAVKKPFKADVSNHIVGEVGARADNPR